MSEAVDQQILRIHELETGLIELLSSVRELAEVYPNEVRPERYPASTLMFSYPEQVITATGGLTDNSWTWVFRLYFDFSDPAPAQEELKRVLPRVLAAIRHDPTLGGRCLNLTVSDSGPPNAIPGEGLLIKTMSLTATTEEV